MEKARIGVSNLDAMLGGGIGRGDAVLVKGGPGAGKTTLGLQWVCAGATDFGEPGVLIVLEETPQQFYRRASSSGWDLRRLEEQNKVRTVFTSAEALSHDILTSSLLAGVLGEISARRVTIDAISHYRLISQDGKQLRQQVGATINALKRIGQTSLLLAEEGTAGQAEFAPEEYLADAVVSLGWAPGLASGFRRLEVLKTSTHDHRPGPALFRITAAGIQVFCPFCTASSVASESRGESLATLCEGLANQRAAGSFSIVEVEARLTRVHLDLCLLAFVKSGAGNVAYLAGSCVNPGDLWEAARSATIDRRLDGGSQAKSGVTLIDPFGRACPRGFSSSRFRRLDGYDDRAIFSLFDTEGCRDGAEDLQNGSLLVCDLSDIYFHLGQAMFRALIPRLVDMAKTRGVSVIGVVDPRLMAEDYRTWLEGAAGGILRLWENDLGRFAQVVKGGGRRRYQPMLLLESDEAPFFQLV